MRVLVLFDGSGCISKAAKELGHDVRSLDILPLPHIDYPIDILDFKPQLLNGWVPDMIWASPPCETFSINTAMKGGGNMYWETFKIDGKVYSITPRVNFDVDKRLKYPERINSKRELHAKLVDKTVKIIKHYERINKHLVWCIENPASGFMKFYLREKYSRIIENVTTYCKYGSPYRKETNIFSNIRLNLKWCGIKRKDGKNSCHHTDSFALRWDHNKQSIDQIIPKSYLERSSIPHNLALEVIQQAENALILV